MTSAARPTGSGRPRRGRTAIIVAAVVAAAVVIVAVAAGGAAHATAKPSRAVSETAGPVAAVDFRGVPGQVTVTATRGRQVRLTGDLDWKSHARAATETARTVGGVLYLTSRCAAGSPCTENYRLTVPAHTAVVLDQTSGHVVVSGLDSALRITATHQHQRDRPALAVADRRAQVGPPRGLVRGRPAAGAPHDDVRAGHDPPAGRRPLPGEHAGHLGLRQGRHAAVGHLIPARHARLISSELELLP